MRRFERVCGSTRLALHCAGSLEHYAQLALAALGGSLSAGNRVVPGQVFSFGGMYLSVQEEPGGLVLSRPIAPDGSAILGEGADVTDLLGTVALQDSLIQELKLEPVEWTLFDKVTVEQGMHAVRKVYLHRCAPAFPEDSGWFIASEGYEPGRALQSVQLLQLFRVRRALLTAVVLPIDYLAFFEGDVLVRVVDPSNRVVFEQGPDPLSLRR